MGEVYPITVNFSQYGNNRICWLGYISRRMKWVCVLLPCTLLTLGQTQGYMHASSFKCTGHIRNLEAGLAGNKNTICHCSASGSEDRPNMTENVLQDRHR